MPIPFADNFIAGSILSLVLPVLLLIAFAVWYVLTAMRMSGTGVTDVVENIDQIVNPDPAAAAEGDLRGKPGTPGGPGMLGRPLEPGGGAQGSGGSAPEPPGRGT